MANILTGDFDVVAEFALPAVNRVLAAMHECERLQHSMSLSVNDNPPPGGGRQFPVVVGAVDNAGIAVADHHQIPAVGGVVGTGGSSTVLGRINPGIVNLANSEFAPVKVEPSHLSGRAQLQLFPPTVDVPDPTGKNVQVTMNVMARYFPDPHTPPVAEFIRGDLKVIAPISQIASEVGNVVEFDLKTDQISAVFVPSFSNQPISAADAAGINLLIKNALRTSFLPSSATLPSNVSSVQFKTLIGSQKAAAVLLNLSDHGSNRNSVTNVFLKAGDDFAFAAGRDFVLASLKPITDKLLSQQFPPVTFKINLGFTTLHISYPITLHTATFDLKPGKIVLTITGHASQSNHGFAGPFDFTATLDFTLQAGPLDVKLIAGGVSLDTTSTVEEIISFFTDSATKSIASARDAALQSSGAFDTVGNMFDLNAQLGPFLNSLLKPADPTDQPPQQQNILMTFTGVDVQPDGIVLHGAVQLLFQMASPQVEFEQITSSSGNGGMQGGQTGVFGDGPDYTALNTWIPGGRIDQYEWSVSVNNQLYTFGVDPNKFVLLHSGPVIEANDGSGGGSLPPNTPLCLTVRGTQLSPQGPVVSQHVSGSVCGYHRTPVIAGGLLENIGALKAVPMLALTRPGPAGELQVSGHTAATAASPGHPAPNLVVHFGDASSAADLKLVAGALKQKKIAAQPTLAVAVLSSDAMSKSHFIDGVTYADNRDGAWELLLGVKEVRHPMTMIVDAKGKVAWKHEGALTQKTLHDALSKHLATVQNVPLQLASLRVRVGQGAPNFLFEYSPGRQLPLSKLNGKPVVLVFWRSSSRPSIEAVRDMQAAAGSAKEKAIVLAINDGESADIARAVAAENGFTATLVTDPERAISRAYGVELWPTIVNVERSGVVGGIRFGYLAGEHADQVKQTASGG